jgi:hypothetical protein
MLSFGNGANNIVTAVKFGPIAQLGERFNGIEEVKGSNPFRSTRDFVDDVPALPADRICTEQPLHSWDSTKGFFVSLLPIQG